MFIIKLLLIYSKFHETYRSSLMNLSILKLQRNLPTTSDWTIKNARYRWILLEKRTECEWAEFIEHYGFRIRERSLRIYTESGPSLRVGSACVCLGPHSFASLAIRTLSKILFKITTCNLPVGFNSLFVFKFRTQKTHVLTNGKYYFLIYIYII